MPKILTILVAWGRRYGLLETPRPVEELSAERVKICAVCPYSKKSKVLEIIGGNAESVELLYCQHCGCPVVQKTLVAAEKCPIKKW